jgi:hypothetical protein
MWSQRETGGTPLLAEARQGFLWGGTSRMSREAHVRICEGLGVKFPGPTRPSGNVVMAGMGTHLATERVRLVNPRLQLARPSSIPIRSGA